MPVRSPASRRRARWQDRSCRWWPPPSGPINCSAARDRARPRSMRSSREPWSRANRSRHPPAAPMISPGRAAKSNASRPEAKRRWHRFRRMERRRRQRQRRRRSRKSLLPSNPAHRCNRAPHSNWLRRHSGISLVLEARRLRRVSCCRRRARPAPRAPRLTSGGQPRYRRATSHSKIIRRPGRRQARAWDMQLHILRNSRAGVFWIRCPSPVRWHPPAPGR